MEVTSDIYKRRHGSERMRGEELKGMCGSNSFEFPYEGKQRNGVVARWRCEIKKD